jgi:hypothetical protein
MWALLACGIDREPYVHHADMLIVSRSVRIATLFQFHLPLTHSRPVGKPHPPMAMAWPNSAAPVVALCVEVEVRKVGAR